MTDQQQLCEGFLAEIEASGLPKAAGEGMLRELGLVEDSGLSKTAREQSFLALFDHRYATIPDLQSALIKESENFREGLKTAMLENGADLHTVEGLFKEAEDRFTEVITGTLSKEAGIGSAAAKFLSGMKAPLRGMAASGRGFGSGTIGKGDFLRSVVPGIDDAVIGLKDLGKLDELHAGTTRIALGDKLQNLGLRGIGNQVTTWGENAARAQANNLANAGFRSKANDVFQAARNEARSASGITAKTQQNLDDLKNIKIPNTQQPGNVSQDVLQAGVDRATNFAKDPLGAKMMPSAGGGGLMGGHMRFTPGRGLGRAAGGALLGGMTLGPLGALGGAAVGGLTGTLGTGGTLAAGAGLYGASKLLGGGGKPAPSEDRNRILPFMGNNWTGGVGGALLGSVIANELGLDGAAGWLLPLLGGVAGYNYLPGMVNSFKDPLGQGANAVPVSHQAGNLRNFGY